ncbi:MAG: glycosyltransferase [Clostridiales bacterium]|jgi:glycosyltransferase involved in cell wall biosynthesis|nr:glycosyltransferase [Clostridiales bacterium]
MKLSVAIATYNGADYIEEQLDSVLKQTRALDEVIICDDCSKDNTVAIVEAFICKHNLQSKWSIEVNVKNLGFGSNFFKAITKTTGDIIFFCDQDDIWTLNRVEAMTEAMERNPAILMLGSEYEPFESTADAYKVSSKDLVKFKNDHSLEHLKLQAKNIFIGYLGSCMCIRRSFFSLIKPYWFEGWAHDEFVWKLALVLDGAYVYHGITVRRRLHSSNTSMGKMRNLIKRINFLEDLLRGHEAALRLAKDNAKGHEAIRLLEKNIESVKLRIELLKEKKYLNTLPLVFRYFRYYHSQKSIPVELYMAIRG